jgi:YebC/PmpR family DNA-binding regulatory protein
MSGHNKWSTIKHKKGAADAKRGKIFTKLIREITAAAKIGGGDPNTNPRLRSAITSAKGENMPADNIERAIKKGTGEIEGVTYEEALYEGYGPGGVAMIVQCLSDNKNRSAAEIRSIFTKGSGNMGTPGSVAWMFEKKGVITVDAAKTTEDKLMEIVLGAGADDMTQAGGKFEVTCAPADFENVKSAIEKAGIASDAAQLTMVPKNLTTVTADTARAVLNLIETLEDQDDVQNVYANCDIPDEVMKELS